MSPPHGKQVSIDDEVNCCYMSDVQSLNPRKRPRPEHSPDRNPNEQKRYKQSEFSSAFWDNLSTIWLTRRALEELDRRNTQSAAKQHFPIATAADLHRPTGSLREIRVFARHGGPDLSDLRGYQISPDPSLPDMGKSTSRGGRNTISSRRSTRKRNPTKSSKTTTNPTTNPTTKATTKTAATPKSSPYDRNFQQGLIDSGVYPDCYEYPDGRIPAEPDNWEEIRRRLLEPRASLSPSQFTNDKFKSFKNANAHASTETQVMMSVIPTIAGDIKDGRSISGTIPLTNLEPLTDGTLVSGNPDLYFGSRPEQLDRQIRTELSRHIMPSTKEDLPIAPNFFLAAKGPAGTPAVAERQAIYDGALGARGMHSLQSYGQKNKTYDNNAYTVTSIYQAGQLKMYTSHPAHPVGGARTEYFLNQISGSSMTADADSFRKGATAFRNLKDWAKEQRDEAIRSANEVRNGVSSTIPTSGDQSQGSTTQIEASLTSETASSQSHSTGTSKLRRSSRVLGDR